ncbi:MAG: hypothetical protein ABF244_00620 [Flavobacteriaceae bacterium]
MKKGTKNLLILGAVAVIGYVLYKKSKKKGTSVVKTIEDDATKVVKEIEEDVADL